MIERSIRYKMPDAQGGFNSKTGLLEKRPGSSGLEIGIQSETAPLKTVAIWGQLGTEAALAQLYPPEQSLFSDSMDVLKVRSEAESFSTLLKTKGVKVYEVRHEFAKLIEIEGQEIPSDIKKPFFDEADKITEKTGIFKPGLKGMISELLDQDIEKYGEARAYLLNKALSLDPEMPMGNLVYGRDTSNVLLGKRVRASMDYPIRQPEIDIYERVYDALGMDEPIVVPEGEKFEGGDAYVHDGVVYVGVGPRTTRGAAIHIYKELKDELDQHGFQFVLVEDPIAKTRPFKEQMDFMHLDTWSMPVAEGKIMVCREEGDIRDVILLTTTQEGEVKEVKTGQSFTEYLINHGQEVLDVPVAEQALFGCNLLNLDENTVILPRTGNLSAESRVREAGQTLIFADLHETTNGYGGAHCMTAQLLRSAPSMYN